MNYRRMLSGPLRAAASLTVVGLLCGAVLASSPGAASATSASATSASATSAADASTKYFGVFREATPTRIASSAATAFGVTPASVFWFDAWATGNPFPVSEAKALWSQGIMPHFTWEPWDTSLGVADSGQIHLQDIIDGEWDSYIRARGAEFASVGAPIMVRFGHEFNGNWYPWGPANNGNNPALFVSAYRHVHDLVTAAGATNVQWIWAFNNGSTPNEAWNDPARAYPGSAYVDWVGIDGYNWGLGPSWDPAGNYWSGFDTMFASAYQKARSIAPDKPVTISEYASSEDGGDKAAWINDMNAQLRSGNYPDLKMLCYFDQNKEELWSAASSSASQAAFTAWLKQPYMNGTGAELAEIAGQYAEEN